MSLRPRLWPPLIGVSTAAAVGVTYAGAAGPLRPLVVLWFLAVCPGMAVVRLLRLRDGVSELVLAVAVSLSLETLVAAIALYGGRWSPELVLDVVAGIALAGAAAETLLVREGRCS